MKSVNFYFVLDVTFKSGIDIQDAKQKRKAGKNIDSLYNPDPTSIYLACSVHGTYVKVNSLFKIKPAEWDFDSQRPLRKHDNYLQLNAFMSKIKSKAEGEYLQLLTNESPINPSTIRSVMEKAIGFDKATSTKLTFWQIFEEFLVDKARNTKSSTMEKYNSTKSALEKFEKKNYRLSFEKMDMQFYEDFKTFSALTLKHVNNTISKSLRNIKTFLGWASDHPKQYNRLNDYKRFRGDNDQPEVIFLTEKELERFRNHDTGSNRGLSLSKDKYVFQCYTGQRIGDILRLKKQDIRPTGNGSDLHWVLYQQKGNKRHPIFIPLLDVAKEIYERQTLEKDDDDLVFHGQNKDTHIKNIRDIAKEVGIDTTISKVNYRIKKRIEVTKNKYDLIGTHTARKTFISICLEKGIRPEQIMAISGHTSVKQMAPYMGLDKTRLSNDLKEKWNKNGNEHSTEG